MLGGAGTFFALAASYFTKVGVVAVVGDDFGDAEMAVFDARGVCTKGIERVAGKSFFWAGKYSDDLADRLTLDTQLNCFATFSPQVPEDYREYPFLMLGNIDPKLQSHVQSQMGAKFVGGDTMNYWIADHLPALTETLKGLNVLMINDHEARQLTGERHLMRAAKKIHAMGPASVVIKRGEFGASLYREGRVFTAPAFPVEEVRDPTGAGDSFAGGFMGYLASQPHVGDAEMRRAMIYGSVMGGFCVEEFGTERLQTLTRDEIDERYQQFHELMRFD